MKNNIRKIRVLILLLMLVLGVGGVVSIEKATTYQVQAATSNGFVKTSTGTYYYRNGIKYTGWLTLEGHKYYFASGSGKMVTGWIKNSAGQYRYFTSAGVMLTGWAKNATNQIRYFDPSTGIMKVGWQTIGGYKYCFDSKNGVAAVGFQKDSAGNTRYFYSGNGRMATGWVKNSTGNYRYFYSGSGVMATGWVKNSAGNYRYFYSNGIMATGWVASSTGAKRYFNTSTGFMAVGTVNISGKSYIFDAKGFLQGEGGNVPGVQASSGTRTLKNYLAGCMLPVGQALYVWGGGWNDSTRKGVSPEWKKWYDSQSSNYNYNNYRDLSTTNRAKGLDCSGFVGWACYQVMQNKSGVGSGYTVVSGDVGGTYYQNGWGVICTQSYLSSRGYKFLPGDVGYNDGHTWIVVGQCSDSSLVIVHSTPQAGCQIAGTPTKDGDYGSSQAIKLAEKYMSRYYGYNKYDYHTSSGHYIKSGNYFRWNRQTLADPDGYASMTADQILKDLFGF